MPRDVLLVLRQQLGVIANSRPTTHYSLQKPQSSVEGVSISSSGDIRISESDDRRVEDGVAHRLLPAALSNATLSSIA